MSKAAPLGLSSKAASRIRRITVLTVALLALSAAILSFSGLLTLALEAGFAPELAWLFPIMIDGMIIVGSLGVIASALVGVSTWYMWLLTLLGVAASVVGNIAAAPSDLLSQTVHAAPPLVFALSVEGLLRVYRTQAAALIAGETSPSLEVPIEEKQISSQEIEKAKGTVKISETSSPQYPSGTITETSSPDKTAKTKTQKTHSNPDKTAKEKIAELLVEEPDISGSEAARRLGIDPSYARKTIRSLRADKKTETISEPLNTDATQDQGERTPIPDLSGFSASTPNNENPPSTGLAEFKNIEKTEEEETSSLSSPENIRN